MGKTAVGLYASTVEAEQVVDDLVSAGFDRTDIRIMLGDHSTRQLREWYVDQPDAADGSRSQWSDGGAASMLVSVGVPSDDAYHYEEALHRGDALVSASTSDQRINEAVDIMSRHEILDIHDRMQSWNTTPNIAAGKEATVPVVEQEVRVQPIGSQNLQD